MPRFQPQEIAGQLTQIPGSERVPMVVPVMVTGKGRSEKGDWPPVNGAKTVAEVEAEMAKSKIERVKRNFFGGCGWVDTGRCV